MQRFPRAPSVSPSEAQSRAQTPVMPGRGGPASPPPVLPDIIDLLRPIVETEDEEEHSPEPSPRPPLVVFDPIPIDILPPPTRYTRLKPPKEQQEFIKPFKTTPTTALLSKPPRRSPYDAVDRKCRFGLLDTRENDINGWRLLTVVVPRWVKGYTLDFREGEKLLIMSTWMPSMIRTLTVGFMTPKKYYRPGTRVTMCTIGVPKEQWEPLVDISQ